MNNLIIYTKTEFDAWVAERRLHDPDFEPFTHANMCPCLVIWEDTEIGHGSPHVIYEITTLATLKLVIEKMEQK